MLQDKVTEPPIWSFIKVSLKNVLVFTQVLLGRIGTYTYSSYQLILNASMTFSGAGRQVKRFGIRQLLYRRGYFSRAPRLGLTAVMSTAVFSALIFPAFDPIGESRVVSAMLDDTPMIADDSLSTMAMIDDADAFSITLAENTRNEVLDHTVAGGDTIGTIAEEYLVSVEALKYMNEIKGDIIRPGDVLKIPPVNGLVHEVDQHETVSSIADLYGVSPQVIVDFNFLEEPFILHQGDELVVPDAKVPTRQNTTATLASGSNQTEGSVAGLALETVYAPQTGTGGFVMPTSGSITQYFWWGHTAIDVAGSCGTPVVAADSGTITFAGWWPGGGGNSVFLDHGNGFVTRYAHLSGFERTGGAVSRGDVIGYTGATGRAYGCHLHFIVDQGGRPVDPLSVL